MLLGRLHGKQYSLGLHPHDDSDNINSMTLLEASGQFIQEPYSLSLHPMDGSESINAIMF